MQYSARIINGWKWIRICLLSLVFYFTISWSLMNWHQDYSEFLLRSLEGPMKYDDPELIKYIRNEVLEPPPTEPYNMNTRISVDKFRLSSEMFYQNFTDFFFKSKRDGFFVEAGALDGQSMSNTLSLEMKQGWTGLLVEPDPSNYVALKRKRRKAWIAKACLSVREFPKQERFSTANLVSSNVYFADIKLRAMGGILREDRADFGILDKRTTNSFYIAQCVPLGSFLVALNVTKVDLFSLDIEFAEEKVITTFDFDRFNVQVLFMEWWNHDKLLWLNDFMTKKGYEFVANQPGDIIFVKKGSDYHKLAQRKLKKRQFIVIELTNKTNS